MPGRLFRFWSIIFQWDIQWKYWSNLFLGEKEGFQFCVRPKAVKGCAAGPGSVQTFLPIGPYELADPILLEVSLVGKDAVWGSQQFPRGKSQHRLLGFGTCHL